ncbi:MAG: nuclear transport factor 2 family protein [Chloroflexi bacterium]|nr:nuclear transport factor 2 family protein [Chloroflexota bacterium]GIW09414.1 MAG: hypothetical protein KatS3mg061_0471 [Dehalococcoidia bacterium]
MVDTTLEQQTLASARAVFADFTAGLAGDVAALERFLTGMHPEMVLYFPQGPNLSRGAYRGPEIRELFAFVRQVYPTGLFITLDAEFVARDTVAFQFHDEAVTRDGSAYRGCVVISFKMREGKLFRYREHFGERWNPPVPPADEPPAQQGQPITLEQVQPAVRAYQAALAGQPGALEELRAHLAEDVVLYFPPREELAHGAYRGREAVMELVRQRCARTVGGIQLEIVRPAVSGDSGGFAGYLQLEADGTRDRSTLFLVFKLKDGKVWRIREYYGPKWGDVVPPHDEDL